MPTPIEKSITPLLKTAQATGEQTLREKLDTAIERAVSEVGTIQQPKLEELVKPVQKINEAMKPYGVQFNLSESGNRVVARVVDSVSGDLIRQIPSETVLHISERLGEMVGVLFKETA